MQKLSTKKSKLLHLRQRLQKQLQKKQKKLLHVAKKMF